MILWGYLFIRQEGTVTEGQATECQGDQRPSGSNAKVTEGQATEGQGDFMPSRLNAKQTECQVYYVSTPGFVNSQDL